MELKSLFNKKLKSFGIPTVEIYIKDLPDWNENLSARFILSRINLIVIGENFYSACIRLMKLKLMYDALNRMKWISQSSLSYDFNPIHLDTLAIIELYSEPQDSRRRLAGAAVSSALSEGCSLLLGVKNIDSLEGAFPYDLESIEMNFEIWKGI